MAERIDNVVTSNNSDRPRVLWLIVAHLSHSKNREILIQHFTRNISSILPDLEPESAAAQARERGRFFLLYSCCNMNELPNIKIHVVKFTPRNVPHLFS